MCLLDRRQAWELDAHGRYKQVSPTADGDGPEAVGSHHALMRLTRERAGA